MIMAVIATFAISLNLHSSNEEVVFGVPAVQMPRGGPKYCAFETEWENCKMAATGTVCISEDGKCGTGVEVGAPGEGSGEDGNSWCSYQLTTNNLCGRFFTDHINYIHHKTENIMNRTLLFISLFSIFTLVSCQSSPKNEAGKQNEVELVAEKQLAFPLDEQTYYLSKSMFQFEENGKEYLHFENTQKSLYDIVIFDIENQQIAKRIPLHKTGPNGLPAVFGSRPSPDSQYILVAQNNISRLSSINSQGEIIRNYNFQTPEGRFTPLSFGSYYNAPAFIKDSCIFLRQEF